MRLDDAMTPARSWEEAAMTQARVRTLLGGAALRSLPAQETNLNVVPVETEKIPAVQDGWSGSAPYIQRRRAALRHVLERQF